MVELDKQDAVIPAQVMKTAEESMRHGGSSVPGCMIWLPRGDFTHCPGGASSPAGTLQACAPSFEAAMKKTGADDRMIVGEGMFRRRPVFPIVKKAREGRNRMVRLMKEAKQNAV